MKFEVDKFLALTALLAGATAAAAGCSSSDAKTGAEGGGAGENAGGHAGTGNAPADGGEAGASEAGASEAGAAGADDTGSCISDRVGAGGAADESSPCALLGAAGAPDCGDEGGNYAAQGCNLLRSNGLYRTGVAIAFNDCASKLANSCDQTGVHACELGLVGEGCSQTTTKAACAVVTAKCPSLSASLCTGIMNLATAYGQTVISNCMDPSNESFYNPYTSGTSLDCDLNLKYCANLPVPVLP